MEYVNAVLLGILFSVYVVAILIGVCHSVEVLLRDIEKWKR